MNIVDLAKTMKEGQFAFSEELKTRVTLVDEYYLHYVNPDNHVLDRIEFNANEWHTEDWEIEIEWVDFCTALQAFKDGKRIKSEVWDKNIYLDNKRYSAQLTLYEINGKWQILK